MEFRPYRTHRPGTCCPKSDYFAALPSVSATGYLVGIVEWACRRDLDGHLEEGEQALGVHAALSHQAPTPSGSTLTVYAELSAVDGTQLIFTVHAHDDAATVCQGAPPPHSHQRRALRRTTPHPNHCIPSPKAG
ncbi:thioesterase family protein [Nonomuraea purpurea]|uniref:Thioesterase family protein n=1 Tax=Nonomuraea purpurea TaxID=1849276 RepID=A0ABV8G7U7_9ACTN